MKNFTKKQQAAISAFQKAYDRFEELGLLAHAAVDSLHVIRQNDYEQYEESAGFGNVSASEALNYLWDNNLPSHSVGYIEGVGD